MGAAVVVGAVVVVGALVVDTTIGARVVGALVVDTVAGRAVVTPPVDGAVSTSPPTATVEAGGPLRAVVAVDRDDVRVLTSRVPTATRSLVSTSLPPRLKATIMAPTSTSVATGGATFDQPGHNTKPQERRLREGSARFTGSVAGSKLRGAPSGAIDQPGGSRSGGFHSPLPERHQPGLGEPSPVIRRSSEFLASRPKAVGNRRW